MSYNYEDEKAYLSTTEGQEDLLKCWDAMHYAFSQCGAVQAGKLLEKVSACSSWSAMAVIERLVEMKRAIFLATNCAWQHRILVPTDWNML